MLIMYGRGHPIIIKRSTIDNLNLRLYRLSMVTKDFFKDDYKLEIRIEPNFHVHSYFSRHSY